ncbi:hypothetical protein B566_EDAN016874 [Ephemera danica]|nr:hypothetical protein B566_EDAN016874 [Ephemera danica]
MSVHYKFKSALEYDTVTFDGLHISVGDLKKAILHQKKLMYVDDGALIAKNTSLIVARVPLSAHQKRTWTRDNAASQLVIKANEDS